MKALFVVIFLLLSSMALAKSSGLLEQVEQHYRKAHSIKMDVTKILKLTLLDKEKKSQGTISIKKGGLLRWETEDPNRSLVLADGKSIWLVDYMAGEDEKPNIIRASNPKKSQPHAIVAFLMGGGRISEDFKVKTEKTLDDHHIKLELKPLHDADQIKWLDLSVNSDHRQIDQLSFEDAVGNITELTFQNIQFDPKLDPKLFTFRPPEGADVTVLK